MKRISTLAVILLLTVAFMGCTDDTAQPVRRPARTRRNKQRN